MSRDLSVVIPAFNEADRIGVTLGSVASYLDDRDLDDEVIVVDDGSTDDTQSVVMAHTDRFRRLRLLPAGFNGGKGRAVRLGMLAATGRHRLFLDADNSTDIRELDGLLAAAAAEPVEPAVIIGSIADRASVVTRSQSRLRSVVGRAGNRLIQRLVLPGIQDSQRGFKVFSGPACDQIFGRCRVDGWAFDVEVLAIARALGHHVLEVPITWRHCDGSRVRPMAYLETLRDVLRIRYDLDHDRYDLTPGRSPARPPS